MEGRDAVAIELDVPLSGLKPGSYICQLNVIDDAGGSFAFPRFAVLVRSSGAGNRRLRGNEIADGLRRPRAGARDARMPDPRQQSQVRLPVMRRKMKTTRMDPAMAIRMV